MSEILSNGIVCQDNRAVRKKYLKWRKEKGIPYRCDIDNCMFYAGPLIWNGKIIQLILDHKTGNNMDNTPQNLRFLCPNCNSQQITFGGRNRGRVLLRTDSAYSVKNSTGGNDVLVFPKTLVLRTI